MAGGGGLQRLCLLVGLDGAADNGAAGNPPGPEIIGHIEGVMAVDAETQGLRLLYLA